MVSRLREERAIQIDSLGCHLQCRVFLVYIGRRLATGVFSMCVTSYFFSLGQIEQW